MDQRHARSPRGAAAVLLCLITACAAPVAVSSGTPTLGAHATAATTAAQLLSGTQTERTAAAVPALADSACATTAAQHRAEALVGAPELTHAPLDAVMRDCGVATAGENLSRAAASPEAVVAAWMGSSGHRANILDPTFTQVGVVCVPDGDEMLCSEVFLGP